MNTKTVTKQRAQDIASAWHAGQWSALYSFASTGKFHLPYALQYFKEIYSEIEAEYFNAREVTRTNKDLSELTKLKRFLEVQAIVNGVAVEFFPSEKYGYTIPFLKDEVKDEIAQKVEPVTYLA